MPDVFTVPDIKSEFDAAIAANRRRELEAIHQTRDFVNLLLSRLGSDLSGLVNDADDFNLRWWKSNVTQAEFNDAINNFVAGYRGDLFGSIDSVINDTVDTWQSATSRAMAAKGFTLSRNFSDIPLRATQEIMLRILGGLNLSQRVWNLGVQTRNQINRIIINSINTGKSAADTAKLLRGFAKSPLTLGERKDLRILKGNLRRLGSSLRHRSERLARTEIANAYHEAQIRAAQRSPIIAGMKWNLSASHPTLDICDSLASANDFGLGAGVYPANSVPFLPHPHDLCFLTSVLRPVADWDKPKGRAPRRRKKTKGIIVRTVTKP